MLTLSRTKSLPKRCPVPERELDQCRRREKRTDWGWRSWHYEPSDITFGSIVFQSDQIDD